MGFSVAVREEVLVRSARHCCLCRKYGGVGIEVHHIVAAADGGPDTLDNAVALCYSCHADAGHYNPRHPRGSRVRPSELKRHRDQHWAAVEAGRIPSDDPLLTAGLQVRHLICLSYELAKEVLAATFKNDHFSAERLLPNAVSRFMSRVLADELPMPRNVGGGDGVAPPGYVWRDESFPHREDLVRAHPELRDCDERPLRRDDFGFGGVTSKLLLACLDAGVSPESIGVLQTWYNQCGEEGWVLEYRLRRPLFVFTEVSNRTEHDLTIAGITGNLEAPLGADPRHVANSSDGDSRLPMPPIALPPGASLLVPSAVLLSPRDEDDLSFEWADTVERNFAEIVYTAYSDALGRLPDDEYLKVGPSFHISSMNIAGPQGPAIVGSRPLDLRHVYLLGQGWLMGSCPHAVVELQSGELVHLGEILVNAWQNIGVDTLTMPEHANILHIAEFEFEVTSITEIRVNDDIISHDPPSLIRGDRLSIFVEPGDEVTISGSYSSRARYPSTSDQVRFKQSLVAGGLRSARARIARSTSVKQVG